MTKLEQKQKELINLLCNLLEKRGYRDLFKPDTQSEKLKSEIAELEKQEPDICHRCGEPNAHIKFAVCDDCWAKIVRAIDFIYKQKPITDADIEAWVLNYLHAPHDDYVVLHTVDVFKTALMIGAKAMRDNEIKHIKK
jgi:hypothetical protein